MSDENAQAGNPDTLLAGKYKTQEELIAGYKALEAKLGQRDQPRIGVTPAGGNPNLDPDGATKAAKFNMAMAALQAGDARAVGMLVELGVNPHHAQMGLGVSQDAQKKYAKNTMDQAGGPDGYAALLNWVNEDPSLSSFERQAFTEALDSGNPALLYPQIAIMRERHMKQTGFEPQQLQVTVPGGKSVRVRGYESAEDAGKATADPRYWKTKDDDYIAEVQARIAVSTYPTMLQDQNQ